MSRQFKYLFNKVGNVYIMRGFTVKYLQFYDIYLQIIDGLRLDDPPLGKLCGQNGSTVVKSTSNVLLVRFYTDDTVSGAGFNASFTLEDGNIIYPLNSVLIKKHCNEVM